MYRDAIQVAADSKKQEVCEDLLKFFTEIGQAECFGAALYTCYDSIRPDVVLELAWRNKILDFAFPFFIQVMREYITKVDRLEEQTKPKEKPAIVEQAYSPAIPQIGYYDQSQMYGMPGGGLPGAVPVAMSGGLPTQGSFGFGSNGAATTYY